jgi:hypothetical protein
MSCNTSTLSAERHVITSRSGLWVIISHAQSQSAYLIRIVSIRASVVITCVCVKQFFYFVSKCSDCSLLLYYDNGPNEEKGWKGR